MMHRFFALALTLCVGVSVSSCGSSGSTATNTPPSVFVPAPGPMATANFLAPVLPSQGAFRDSATVPLPSPSPNAASATLALPSDANGDTGTMVLPLAGSTIPSGTAAHFSLSASADSGLPPLSARRVMAVRSSRDTVAHSAVVYADVNFTNAVSLAQSPAFTFTAAGSYPTSGISYYLALYDPLRPSLGWQYGFEGPATVNASSGSTQFAFATNGQAFAFVAYQVYTFAVVAVSAQAPAPTPAPSNAPTVAPSATPAPVAATPSALSFNSTQASAAQAFTVSESGYGGAFSILGSSGCANIASISGSSPTFTVTPTGAGTCQVLVAGDRGASTNVTVAVAPTLAYLAFGKNGLQAVTPSGTVAATYPFEADFIGLDDTGNIYALTDATTSGNTVTTAAFITKYPRGSTTASARYTPSTPRVFDVFVSGAGELVSVGLAGGAAVFDVWDPGTSGNPSRTFTRGNSTVGFLIAGFVAHDGTLYMPYYKQCGSNACVAYDVVPAGASAPSRTIAESIVPQAQQGNFTPNYFAVGPDGTLYVTEWAFSGASDPLSGIYVYPPSGSETYVQNGATAAQGIDVDASGNVYVMNNNSYSTAQSTTADTVHTISVYSAHAAALVRQITSGFTNGYPLTVDDDGTIFFADFGESANPNGAVFAIPAGGTTLTRIAATATGSIILYNGVREKTFSARSTLSTGAHGASHGGSVRMHR